jgi:tetratricopeptide (TPR) repeat protein
MGGTLTVSERILYHLNAYVKYEDKYEVPFDVTQDGVSQACSISRAHAAVELKKLKSAGIIEERLSHVKKGKAKRKVYFLTPKGKADASDVLQYVKDNEIEPMVDTTRISPDAVPPKSRGVRRSTPLPAVRYFYGREKDIELSKKALATPSLKILALRGIPGIGKTTMAAKIASELTGQRVFWYSAKPWDSPKTFLDSLAKFFSDNGSRKIETYAASGRFELGEIAFLLNDELAENGYTFVFDDADCSDNLQEFLKMFRHSSGSSKIIVTSEVEPRFYDRSDVVARNEVVEVELQGLDRKAALELLESRGIKGRTAEELASITKGHPLSLEMVTESGAKEAKYQVSRFFEETFYAGLTDVDRSLLQLSSVFQRPFPSDAIPKEMRQTRKGSMLREVAPGSFEIHASLRDFVYESMTKEERARWHSVAADYYLRQGELQERLHHLILANRTLESEMLMARSSDDLLGKGNVQRLWGSISSFEPSKPKYRMQVLLLKARAANTIGEYGKAWSMLKEVAREGDPPMLVDALVEMGRIKSKKGELDEASRIFADALDKARDMPGARAKALRGLGVVESKLGNYSKAQELLERSARDSMAVMDQKGMLLAHMELGNVFIGRGMYEEAIDHFSKCAAGFGPVELTNVYVNMGIACAHLGKAGEARLHLENAVRLAGETGQPRAKAYALTSLSEVLLKGGDAGIAKEHCFSALEVFTEIGDKLGASAAYANLGMAERAGGNMPASEEYYVESLKAIEGMDVPWSMGVRKMEYGAMLAEKGERAKAEKMLRDSKKLFEKISAKDMLAKVNSELKGLR